MGRDAFGEELTSIAHWRRDVRACRPRSDSASALGRPPGGVFPRNAVVKRDPVPIPAVSSRAQDVRRLLGRALRWAARSKPSFSARRVRLGVDEPRPADPRPPRGRRAVGEPGAAGRAPAGPRRG